MTDTLPILPPLDDLVAHPDPDNLQDCHCGQTDRAFLKLADHPAIPDTGKATNHLVTQTKDGAKAHYHKKLTEQYTFLWCGPGAGIELNGHSFPAQTGTRVCIPPTVRHRLRGICQVAVIVMPGHIDDHSDDYFD